MEKSYSELYEELEEQYSKTPGWSVLNAAQKRQVIEEALKEADGTVPVVNIPKKKPKKYKDLFGWG